VVSAIYTFQEFQDQATADGQIGSIHQADAVAGEAPLEKYLLQHGRTREDARRLSERLFNDVAAVTFDGTAMSDLVQRFDSGRPLTTEAETVLSQLLAKHQANLIAALSDEEEVIAEAGFSITAARQVPASAGEGLLGAAQDNLLLLKELISITADQSRPAEAIVPDLIASAHRLRLALSDSGTTVQASQKAQP
jgi:hypothetical protein